MREREREREYKLNKFYSACPCGQIGETKYLLTFTLPFPDFLLFYSVQGYPLSKRKSEKEKEREKDSM